MLIHVSARQEFVILTHVRSGSGLLADLLARNGIGHAEEHLIQRAPAKADRPWDPKDVLAAARCEERSDLKRHAGIPAATDAWRPRFRLRWRN